MSEFKMDLAKEVDGIEMNAAYKAYDAGLGASEWESFLTLGQTRRLIALAELGYGTWAREPMTLQRMKAEVSNQSSAPEAA